MKTREEDAISFSQSPSMAGKTAREVTKHEKIHEEELVRRACVIPRRVRESRAIIRSKENPMKTKTHFIAASKTYIKEAL